MQVIGTRRAIRLSLTIPWELKPLELKFSTQKCSYHQNETRTQGHPMDLFLKISVLQAHSCWLGDAKEIIVLGRKVLLGKR